jgi:flagellar biosynthesis protein FlhB
MYYQERKTIVTTLSGILVFTAYCIYVYQKLQAGAVDLSNDLKFWATTMLIFIGAGIVMMIIIMIVFHIINAMVNEITRQGDDDPMVEDEMDKLIELKAMRNSYIIVGIGFVLSLVSLVMQMPLAVMINIIYLSFNVGSILEGFSQLYFYRRGV